MDTSIRYKENRTYILNEIKGLRDKRNYLINDWGFDDLFPADISELNRSIKAHQAILGDMRKRYYSQLD